MWISAMWIPTSTKCSSLTSSTTRRAPTYRRLLEHFEPRVLLGLTATPERTDELDVTHWFAGRIVAELRLWDALDQGLLCPFQYFGLSDVVDLSGLTWSRGGYDIKELANIYTAN